MSRQKHFDAARALAALLVIMVHTQQFFNASNSRLIVIASMGQLGVQLFFVISAFLIFDSINRLGVTRNGLIQYFVHRFFRIAPLYYLAIILNTLMWRLVASRIGLLDEPSSNYTVINILINILLLHGLVPAANQSIVGGGWSIGTEFLFYFIAPLIFSIRRNYIVLVIICLACFSLVYIATLTLQPLIGDPPYVNDNGFLYYSFLNQAPVFICGIVLFSWRESIYRIWIPYAAIGCIVPLYMIYWIWTRDFTGTLTFAFIPALAGVSSVFLIVFLSHIGDFPHLLMELGKRSFSMYLWNLPALMIVKSISEALGVAVPFAAAFPIVASIVFVFSGITYYGIERPFIQFAKQVSSRIERVPTI